MSAELMQELINRSPGRVLSFRLKERMRDNGAVRSENLLFEDGFRQSREAAAILDSHPLYMSYNENCRTYGDRGQTLLNSCWDEGRLRKG